MSIPPCQKNFYHCLSLRSMQLPCDTRFSPQHNILILILNNIWAALKSLSFNRSLKVSIIWHHCIGTYIYLGWCRILTEVGLDDICNSCVPSTLVVGGKLVKECCQDYSIIHAPSRASSENAGDKSWVTATAGRKVVNPLTWGGRTTPVQVEGWEGENMEQKMEWPDKDGLALVIQN